MKDTDVSFIIPAFNEELCIANVLESIRQHINDVLYEIIVIDNGSTDSTAVIARGYADEVFSLKKASISEARNTGVAKAKGDLLVFLDADVRITSEWAQSLIKNKERLVSSAVISGAKYVVRNNPSLIEKYWFEPLSKRKANYINGGNIVVSKKSFNVIGGFDVTLQTGEDVAFCLKAQSLGIDVEPDNQFRAIHDGFPVDIKNFWRREVWHGKGDYKDFSTFLNSRIALLALVLGLLHYLLVAALLFDSRAFILISISGIVMLSFAVSLKIFSAVSLKLVFYNLYLSYLYLLARHVSLYFVLFAKR
jgi:glycosyltransferase involved in cell wall biosynthesis